MATAMSSPAATPAPGGALKIRIPWRALTMVIALVAIWSIFAGATWWQTGEIKFLTARNLTQLTRQMAVTSLLGIGMVLVIVAGQIDLSVGPLALLLGGIGALLHVKAGLPFPVALALALAAGAALGALQGSLVAWLNIPSFIVTLGGMLVFQGALQGLVTDTISLSEATSFEFIGTAFVPVSLGWVLCGLFCLAFAGLFLRDLRHAGKVEAASVAKHGGQVALAIGFTAVMNHYQGIPVSVLLLLILAGVLFVVAQHTPFGRHLYAIGGNKEAAFYSGINIRAHVVGVFALMGLMSAIAGITLSAWLGAATSGAGENMELDAIAAAVIGGTSLQGGVGNVWGALLGAMVMASLDNGMSLLNIESFWQFIIKGLILVAAVAVDMAGRRD